MIKEDELKNPLTLAFNLLEGYKEAINAKLGASLQKEEDIKKISANLTVDHDILISLNTKYAQSERTIGQFQEANPEQISATITNNILNSSLVNSEGMNLTGSSNFRLYQHQESAIEAIINGKNILLSSGTGSGKTESFLIPILSHCDNKNPKPGFKAIIIYPMNALANDQLERLAKYTKGTNIKYGCYVGSTPKEKIKISNELRLKSPNQLHSREEIVACVPDILITNHVMLDWMLTDSEVNQIFKKAAESLKFIVVDEIHTFRGSKAVHLKYLLRRLKFHSNKRDKIIHIGTSATLKSSVSNIEGAFINNDLGDETLDQFVNELFDIKSDEYRFIAPVPKTNNDDSEEIIINDFTYLNTISDSDFGWSLNYDKASILKALNILTTSSFTMTDLFSKTDLIYKRLNENLFVHKLKEVLTMTSVEGGGAQLFLNEIVPLLSDVKEEIREDVAKSFFSIMLYLNQINQEKPFLDFRIHLFLKNLGGYLKKCLKCNIYHSGKQKYCNDCGYPLFNVYKNDIDKCIGKISDNKLKFELNKESDDKRNSFYLLISAKKNSLGGLSFEQFYNSRTEEIELKFNEKGEIILEELPEKDISGKLITGYFDVLQLCIPLSDNRKDYQYIGKIVNSILEGKTKDKKLLAFCDNKEKVSKYSMITQDEFVSNFFEEYLKYIISKSNYPNPSIEVAYQIALHSILKVAMDEINPFDIEFYYNNLSRANHLDEKEKEAFKDFPIWFFRYISEKPDESAERGDLLKIIDNDALNNLESKLCEIFINKRALYKLGLNLKNRSKFINFYSQIARQNIGFHTDPSHSFSKELIWSYSLGLRAEGIDAAGVVAEHSIDEIAIAIKNLEEKEILLRVTERDERLTTSIFQDDKFIYQLNPKKIVLSIHDSKFNSYEEIKSKYLLYACYHSSELKNKEREETENAFKSNAINTLFCTPTLELGIDIGQLKEVLMIGVPPLPSNYAQRAGRAGRGSGSNFALIVTFCEESSNHDMYYFNAPKEMVNGVISPPRFDPNNINILKKHIAAFLLEDHSNWNADLENFIERKELFVDTIKTKIDYLTNNLNNVTVTEGLISDIFDKAIMIMKNKDSNIPPRNIFYARSLFPDYEFSKDGNIYAVDEKNRDKIKNNGIESIDVGSYALSEGEAEAAIKKFVPDQKVFMSGSLYNFSSDGIYDETISGEENENAARSYKVFFVNQEKKNANKSELKVKHERVISFTNDMEEDDIGGLLKISNMNDSKIIFKNRGRLSYPKPEPQPFKDEKGSYIISYKIYRRILELNFDGLILADTSYIYSFVAALNRAIVDIYKLDEMELKIIPNAKKVTENEEETENVFSVIIYDKSGSFNIDFQHIIENFSKILEYAYKKLSTCECRADGCPLCIKSYTTQSFGHLVKKRIAKHIVGYLAGYNKFDPFAVISQYKENPMYDSEITINIKFGRVTAEYKDELFSLNEIEGFGLGQNGKAFKLISKIIQEKFRNENKGMLIMSNNKTIVDGINEGKINTDLDELLKLQFQFLRYDLCKAEII